MDDLGYRQWQFRGGLPGQALRNRRDGRNQEGSSGRRDRHRQHDDHDPSPPGQEVQEPRVADHAKTRSLQHCQLALLLLY